MSLVEQNTIKNGRVNNKVSELNAGGRDNKDYNLEAIWDTAVYAEKSKSK